MAGLFALPPLRGETASKTLWAVGGGKGGTGKSFLAANLGIALSRRGKRVLLVDADLGCANLHTCLGLDYPSGTLSDFLSGRVKNLSDIIVETEVKGLHLLSGAQDFLEIANPKHSQKARLIRRIAELDFDHILLDLGAGTAFTIIDFFLAADNGILVLLPEPTSIENVYRFIKSAFYRRFKQAAREPEVREIVTAAMDEKNERGIKNPYDLIEHVRKIDPAAGGRLWEAVGRLRPKLVVNQVRSRDDITLGFSMRSSCSKYFGIRVAYSGYIEYDDRVWQATKARRPLLVDAPFSAAARGIDRVADHLLADRELSLQFVLS